MRTRHGFERLAAFADAVVAIALTLLVLPLSEIVRDIGPGQDVGDLLSEHRFELGSFVLSFVVIWVLWASHHRLFEFFEAYDGVLLRLTLVWLFTIVVLPFVTQLLTSEAYGHGGAPVYDGVLLVSSLCLAGMSWWGHRRPELLHQEQAEVRRWLTEPVVPATPIILLVALLLSIFAPAIGMWPLLALVLDDRLEHLWLRIRGRRPAAPGRARAR